MFVRANDVRFQMVQLVGMQFLSEMNYVHRDLAARNVLVNSLLVCKKLILVSVTKSKAPTKERILYTTRGGKIPMRWTAPEAIAFRKFTSVSDVWSFGIVVWEVLSYGERPYWNLSNQDVIKSIEKALQITSSDGLPGNYVPINVRLLVEDFFDTHYRTVKPLCPEAPDMANYSSIAEWLSSIKMIRYLENFEQAGITSMETVIRLNVPELNSIGINLVSHQKKIMNSIQMISRNQLSANLSESFV